MIKGIIFDLDNTILDREATFAHFIGDQYFRYFEPITAVSKDEFIKIAQRYDNFGYSPKSEVYAGICSETGSTIDPAELEADFRNRYGDYPILFADSLEVLESLGETYPLGLVTNGRVKGQNKKIDRSMIRDYFSSIKISEGEGVKKPNPEIYLRCLRDLGVEPKECLVVGDHPENDICSAKECGMMAIWKRNSHFTPPDQVDGIIHSLSEIQSILNALNTQQGAAGNGG